ncbi:AAA family ATPase [Bacillus sp. S/N-304-OC-R1]|uniref:AAA family ATPase n=1 Tax=Bacillus sp. S/N-304-OC-R1 TaxID=2758034 RepID=UPI0021B01BCC|nr:AAA family ATPase [Bacillus sp. S/N-304-OC-R1]
MISRVIIKNYKSIQYLDLKLNDSMNILVGNNEQGKSTILEAINLALTGLLHRRTIHNEINPFIFNKEAVTRYIAYVNQASREKPPHILIEVYLEENEQTSHLKGTINSIRENLCGIKLEIEFNEEFNEEYEHYIVNKSDIYNVPIEYYKVSWYSFASNPITSRNVPVKCILIDTTEGKTWTGPDQCHREYFRP